MYQRKTKDVWELQGDYGCGYEYIHEFDSRRDAADELRRYEKEAPQHSYRIRKRRERLEAKA